jgi:hypothetical protein
VKYSVRLELLTVHAKASFYVVRLEGDERSEFEKFIDEYEARPAFRRNIQELVYWMDVIGKNGALERYFRMEGGKVKALPVDRSRLRLYCYRLADNILLWAGGGYKSTKSYQEDPALAFQVAMIRTIGEGVLARVRNGMITNKNGLLSGNMKFEISI